MSASVRQGRKDAFRKICQHVRGVFPFETQKEFADFQKLEKAYERRIPYIPGDARAFFPFLEEFFARLKNSHTKLGAYPGKLFFKPRGYSVWKEADMFYLVRNPRRCLGRIVSIDGETPKRIFSKWARRISSSTQQYRELRAKEFLLVKEQPATAVIRLYGRSKPLFLQRVRVKELRLQPREVVKKKMFPRGIGYLQIKTWISGGSLGKEIPKYLDVAIAHFVKKKSKLLIIDVRGNGGGSTNLANYLAGHLFKKQAVFGVVKERISPKTIALRSRKLLVQPKKPYLSFPIILLSDRFCYSANEYFIAGLKDNRRAYVIGEKTSGGSGNPELFEIPLQKERFWISVATWKYFRPNGKPLEGRGIAPNEFIPAIYKDFCRVKDRILGAALRKAGNVALTFPVCI